MKKLGLWQKIEQRLQRRFNETLDAMGEAFVAIDRDWIITQVNKKVLDDTGHTRESLIGRDFREVFFSAPGSHETTYWREYHRLMADRVAVEFEDYYEPLKLWTAVRAYPSSDGGMTVIAADVTKQKEIESALREAKEEAERANVLKSAFLANMSHEIRTPLGAMIGFADLLRDPKITSEEKSSYLDILARNGEQLSVIINDILDLSKVEAGHLSFEYTPLSPDEIALDVVSLLKPKAREKQLELEYISDTSTAKEVVSDPVRIRQVLLNLVTNAIKFTPEGSVTVRSRSYRDSDGQLVTSFAVTDTGIGISSEHHDTIFDMFTQGDGSLTRRFGGTGLGLALSRRLARSLEGDVVLRHSQSHVGSTFVFTFVDQPEKRTFETERGATVKSFRFEDAEGDLPLEGIRVLTVDDSPDNQKLISRLLLKAGAQVFSAVNGQEGFEKALTGDYDLVLMDLQMPVMDGYAATQRLREHGYTKPIIALSAHSINDIRGRVIDAGCNDQLSKPINPRALVSTVARYSHAH